MGRWGWEGAGVALAIDEVRDARRKRADVVFRVVVFATILLMGAIFVRVVQLQLAPGDRLAGFVQDRASRRVYEGARGDLLDRRGRVLASTRGGFRLFVDPSELEEPFGPTLEQHVKGRQQQEDAPGNAKGGQGNADRGQDLFRHDQYLRPARRRLRRGVVHRRLAARRLGMDEAPDGPALLQRVDDQFQPLGHE